jgi:DNA-binding NtrC family response regulator
MNAPKWTHNERDTKSRPMEQAARCLALAQLLAAGELDLSNKSELARRLGIGRHTLDRDLHTIQMAEQLVAEIRRKLSGSV